MQLDQLLKIARGDQPADLMLRDARVVNVFTGELEEHDIAIANGVIVGIGADYQGTQEVYLDGQYLAPGFIDGHMHLESSMVLVPEFARAVVPQGTTTIVIDPHEIANVLGLEGIRYMLDSSQYTPLNVFVMLPSAVPATPMETAGAALYSYDLFPFLQHERVLGIAEMMNYPGVLDAAPDLLTKIIIAGDKRVDGHAPGLSGPALNAYITAGVHSDHECTMLDEAAEKLRRGMYIMIREASSARNMETLLPLITTANSRRCMLVTDDRTPADLLDEGHINFLVRKAIRLGLDPIVAIQMVTLNPAEYFGLRTRGAIAPGYVADLVVLDTLTADFQVQHVYRSGELVAVGGELLAPMRVAPAPLRISINLHNITHDDFRLPAQSNHARIIGLVPDQIVTRTLVEPVKIEAGAAVADTERDILKLAVVERHRASGNVGLGFVQGFELQQGALASSVAHDSHNIIVVGTNDADMLAATITLAHLGGGQVAVADGRVLASVPLPMAGLMSDQPIEIVRAQVERLHAAASELGCRLPAPFMALSFLALPVIPELKLTDQGLVDVNAFRIISVFV